MWLGSGMEEASNAGDELMAGVSFGGLMVVAGILIAIFSNTLVGLLVALLGFVAFGGFARGRRY